MSTGPHSTEAAQAAVPATVFDETATELARTYGEALVNAAEKEGQAEDLLNELDELRDDIWLTQPRFVDLLTSGTLRPEDRDRVLVRTFEGRALPLVVKFLRVLNRHARLDLFPAILAEARAIWDRRQNRRPVTVRSAQPLDEGQQAALRERIGQMLAATPIVRWEVDPDLIGGLVVQVGDDVYDASVRSRLRQLRRKLVEGKIHDLQARRDQFSAAS